MLLFNYNSRAGVKRRRFENGKKEIRIQGF